MNQRALTIGLIMCFGSVTPSPSSADTGSKTTGTITGTLSVVKRGKKQNAAGVVFLKRVRRATKKRNRTATITQKHEKFKPKWVVVTKGGEVSFPNNDTRTHNVFHGSGGDADYFDLKEYGEGVSKSRKFYATDAVYIECNIHPDMWAWVFVVPNDYFDETTTGTFSIPNVPPGTYTMQAWLPTKVGGTAKARVKVSAGKTTKKNLVFTEGKPPKSGINKYGIPESIYN